MTRSRRRPSPKPRVSPSVLERINPHAAGIDCGSAEHYVAVPPDRDPTPVRSFATFTGDLQRLADWLTACRVTSVAMEATGVYWIPLYEILEARGFTVSLVNARHVKNVPGRKSDVSDCEWLRDLHIVGLLRGSFRPTDRIVALRAYLRHRTSLVESAGTHVQRMQKALVQMNVQLPLVVSDIVGVTGLRILHDIVAGGKHVDLPTTAHNLVLDPVAVAAGKQTDLDDKGIAKTAREEKLRARAEAKKNDVENERMASLYRQHVLKEAPPEPTLQIKGLSSNSKKKEPVQEVLHKSQQ